MLRSSHQAAGAPLASRACGPWPIPVESVVSVAPPNSPAPNPDPPAPAPATPAATADARWSSVETRMRRLGNRPDALIEALHAVQEAYGFIDRGALRAIGEALSIPPSTVFGVATFYHYFELEPRGTHTCVVCTGTACYINGADAILGAIRGRLGVEPDQTTADGRLSLGTGRCFGSCSLAPAAIVDGQVLDRVTAAELVDRLERL